MPPPRPPVARSRWRRPVALLVLVAVVSVVAVLVGLPDADRLREAVGGTGSAAPVVFVLLYALATLAPLPKSVLSVAAGLLFGFAAGVALVWVAAVSGALAAFALGRVLGRDAVERSTGARMARVDALLGRAGVLAVLGARLVPVLPFTAVNYAAGLTAVRPRDYLVGTALGIVPGTVAYVALGAYGSSPASWPFLTAVGALVLLAAGGAVAGRWAAAGRARPRGQGAAERPVLPGDGA